ncbi:39216_t:CDS:2 [Gigaspora margarita]|uniref:39216_t:CDS:1 n=1 Tax=Gigaspora margarita TaxID=4874 RepID=A0ABN7UCY2_GIGMA|nr:39216_t:CDS:2 [Gigaspora margarita]
MDISNRDLVGSLKLEGFSNLENFDCSHNQLISLNLTESNQLAKINCSHNNLAGLAIVFSPFSRLKELYLGTSDLIRINLFIYNQFYGSLKPLQNCQDLERLCISNTEINYGFEYLSDSLKEILVADMRERLTGEDLGHTQILAELALFDGDFNHKEKEFNVALGILEGVVAGVKKQETIREKYERIMTENPQLRKEQLESLLMVPEEKHQAQIQINPQK